MSDDPFAPESNNTVEESTIHTPSPADDVQNYYSVEFTLKAHTSYDGEWIKPKVFGPTAEETAHKAKELLEQLRDQGVFKLAADAAQHTRSLYQGGPKSNPNAAQPHQNNNGGGNYQRQQRPRSNGGSGKSCEHGEMTYRSGTNRSGKTYKGYFCPDDVCKPTWVS